MGNQACPKCGGAVSENDYFCPHCGKKIKAPPLSAGIGTQLVAYLVSVFAPPFGLWYTYRYFKNGDSRSKKIAVATIILTVFSIVATIWTTELLFTYVNREIQKQFDGLLF